MFTAIPRMEFLNNTNGDSFNPFEDYRHVFERDDAVKSSP